MRNRTLLLLDSTAIPMRLHPLISRPSELVGTGVASTEPGDAVVCVQHKNIHAAITDLIETPRRPRPFTENLILRVLRLSSIQTSHILHFGHLASTNLVYLFGVRV